jgi:hypothetical protein
MSDKSLGCPDNVGVLWRRRKRSLWPRAMLERSSSSKLDTKKRIFSLGKFNKGKHYETETLIHPRSGSFLRLAIHGDVR